MSIRIIDIHCGWGASPAAPGWSDAAQVRSSLSSRRVQTAFIASEHARWYDMTAGNEEVAEVVNKPRGTEEVDLRGWMVVHPARLEDVNALMRSYMGTRQFIGAALYPDTVTGRPVTAHDAKEVVQTFRRYSKPLLIQTPNAEAMAEVVQLAQEMSGVKIIASGMGGQQWREAIDMAVKPLNLFLDISGVLSPERLEYAVEAMSGTRKLLFASGKAPYTDPAAIVGLLYDIPLSEEDRLKVLSGNALKLFGLDNEIASSESGSGNDLRPMQQPISEESLGGLGTLGN